MVTSIGQQRATPTRRRSPGTAWTCGVKTTQWASIADVAWSEDVDAALVAGWLVGQRGEVEEVLIAARRPARAAQASLLRDIFGNPFRRACLDPGWRTPTVLNLARAAYDHRRLPSGFLDNAVLGGLSDALDVRSK